MIKSNLVLATTLLVAAATVHAGGNQEFVPYPPNYQKSMVHYATLNRGNGKQVAKMYADHATVDAYRNGKPAPTGAWVIMEVYKAKFDANKQPVVGVDGIFEIAGPAATAVMHRLDSWPAGFPASDRAGGWGFAMYTPDGKPKENKLECAKCHVPLDKQDFLVTHDRLMKYASQH